MSADGHADPAAQVNYLAHLFLAGNEPGDIAGALLGDFVKGRIDETLPSGLRGGISLHRKIDVFTDAHPLTLVSRNRFSGDLRRYAGIIVDLAYDHFLATKWPSFCQMPLQDFTNRVYGVLLEQRSSFEGNALRVVERMVEQDWLGSYVSLKSVSGALAAISRRLTRPNPLGDCDDQLLDSYVGLEADFVDFFPDLMEHASIIKRDRAHEAAHSGPWISRNEVTSYF